MIDPVLHLILTVGFTLLLLSAGWHKLSDRLQFQGVLQNYQLLPRGLVPLVAPALGLTEILLGLAWASRWQVQAVALGSAVLLGVYGLAMAINLLRGRHYIDCGCGFSSGSKHSDNAMQRISWSLVLRNAGLALVALVAMLPQTQRTLGWLDYGGVIMATFALVLFYGALNQLVVNRNAIDSWRKTPWRKANG